MLLLHLIFENFLCHLLSLARDSEILSPKIRTIMSIGALAVKWPENFQISDKLDEQTDFSWDKSW